MRNYDPHSWDALVDSKVELAGLFSGFQTENQRYPLFFHTSSMDETVVREQGFSDPTRLPVVTISEMVRPI